MKPWWATQFARIDALSLRERVFLFLSVIACSLALADALWLSPAQVAHKQLMQNFSKQSAELQRIRNELTVIGKPIDGVKTIHDEIDSVKSRLDEVNQNVKDVLPESTQVSPLAQVLVHFLSRHEGLTLVRTTVAAPDMVSVKAVQPVASVAAGVPSVGLTRQGIELTVTGPYPELVRYVQTLENALPHVRWGSMKLQSEKQLPELTLQLFLLGVQP